ncbi:3-deoxy-D-arabinoheptulosonate-7-phosphate synthase [Pontibacter mucosus]|uniref:3-deoxy-D-arabinoheptulosonate-7-phosphate synthase n=1 Tax=Pontibacter mucosus TaxID=1649266 RepID=A0A2T5YP38_9BACT|nr:3-deoxy-7-phosphoheptulonate synthase [Pontibacter mucosus]PTX21052.1 3-deoxy-D-arabinoheptulosonate-7-phosphate synthase [Pontibacter mucosus]
MRASRTPINVAQQGSFRHADGSLVLIAGPCSAESEEQLLKTAQQLKSIQGISVLRAGIWKSRTRPNSFKGVGTVGLQWLDMVKKETGLRTACEVANAQHAEEAMKYGVDILSISGRATVNPFAMEEIAAVLKGTNMPVLVNNPVYPDMGLWLGALERLNQAGITDLGLVNRGFAADEQYPYRNHPRWDYMLQLKDMHPELPILCDAAHIAGRRSLLYPVSQKAVDLGVDGLLFESHMNPAAALSSPQQQLMPQELELLINAIRTKVKLEGTNHLVEQLDDLSQQMDSMDKALVELLLRRREVSQKISLHQMGDVQEGPQASGWQKELDAWLRRDDYTGKDSSFVKSLMDALQQHRISPQSGIGSTAVA